MLTYFSYMHDIFPPQFDDKRFFHHVQMPIPLYLFLANKNKIRKNFKFTSYKLRCRFLNKENKEPIYFNFLFNQFLLHRFFIFSCAS